MNRVFFQGSMSVHAGSRGGQRGRIGRGVAWGRGVLWGVLDRVLYHDWSQQRVHRVSVGRGEEEEEEEDDDDGDEI